MEGTAICARQGLKKIELEFEGSTLGELLAALPAMLGMEVGKDLSEPALQLVINGRILTAPFDPEQPLHPGDRLSFLTALDGG
ncbi:MAG: MoaD/ThiS family protein [Deltaproteobacteria bacterium]|nr:MoaD/ThiS family protein [Deltaproteobacteria bacterium]